MFFQAPVSVLHSPVAKFPTYNQGKSGFLYPNNLLSVKTNTKGWVSTDKLKNRNKVNDSLNEQNQGPRTANAKGGLVSGGNSVRNLALGGSGNVSSKIRTDQYNLHDFLTKYDHALFFVIKSYSEDDIHKSIKYNVWASTPNGNKRLDGAFQDAQKRMEEKGCKCPVFLFFSVRCLVLSQKLKFPASMFICLCILRLITVSQYLTASCLCCSGQCQRSILWSSWDDWSSWFQQKYGFLATR